MKIGKIVFTLLGLGVVGFAQQPSNRALQNFYPEMNIELLPEMPVDPATYEVKSGDSLLVVISGYVSYSYPTGLTPSGELLIQVPTNNPFVGLNQGGALPMLSISRLQLDIIDKIDINGLTITEAQKAVSERFGRYLHRVTVTLSLLAPRRFKVFVLGEVRVPGGYIASSFLRVADMIGKAQGVTPMGSRVSIELRRNGKFFMKVNLERFERSGNLEDDPSVSDGDVIYVPLVNNYVTIRGAVVGRTDYSFLYGDTTRTSTNETYELEPNETFLDVLNRAGGPIPWADKRNCYIERLTHDSRLREKIPVDLYKTMTDKDVSNNPVLENGDILVVPFLESYVYVQGAVATPHVYPYEENRKVSEYIGRAGGFNARADITKVKLIKANGKSIYVQNDPIVERGESIYVPERPVYNWQLFLSLGATITTLITAWIALTSR